MSRIDLVKLRKRAGMSQRELAELLQVRPSFLSAIENGKSRLPDEKMAKIKEIFEIDSFDDYLIDEHAHESMVIPPHTHTDSGDSLTMLLNHFHELAHRNSHSSHDEEATSRIDFLTKRNDRLSERVDTLSERIDTLREQLDTLRDENLRLKELLLSHNIPY